MWQYTTVGQTISDQHKINVFFRCSSNIYNAAAKSYNLHSLRPCKPWNLCKLTMPNESITAELGSIHQFLTSMSCVALALCECVNVCRMHKTHSREHLRSTLSLTQINIFSRWTAQGSTRSDQRRLLVDGGRLTLTLIIITACSQRISLAPWQKGEQTI